MVAELVGGIVLFFTLKYVQVLANDVTYHVLECFPGSLQVIQVSSTGLHRRVVELLEGCSA